MKPLNRKLHRDLTNSKGMLLTIISIMCVGVLFFVGMASLYFNLNESRRLYYGQCRMADFTVSLNKIPNIEVNRLHDIEGVSEFRSRIMFNATVDLPSVHRPISAQLYSLPAKPSPVVNNIIIRKGSYFTDSLLPEIIVNETFAQERNLEPGDKIHLLLNERKQEFYIVGTALSSEFVYVVGSGGLIPDPANFGIFFVKESLAEELLDFQEASNQIVGLLAPTYRENPDDVLENIETLFDPYGVSSVTPLKDQSSHFFLSTEIDQLKVNAIILPGIFLTVAAIILNILMLRLVEQQRTTVGTLKAIGYTNSEILVHYLKFGSVIGLLGGISGSVLGYYFANFMTKDVYSAFFHFPKFINRPYPLIISCGIGISLFCSILGSLRGVNLVLKLTPAEAMRPKPPIKGKRIWLEQWKTFWKKLSLQTQFSLRGIARNRMRSFTGIFTASMGSMLLIMVFVMSDGIVEMVHFQFSKMFLNDFEIGFKDARDYGALLEAKRLPGVDYAEPVLHVGCTLKNEHREKKVSLTGLVVNSQLTVPVDVEGNRITLPKVGILLSTRLADHLKVKVGDLISFIPTDKERDQRKVPIAGIVNSYLGLSAYSDIGYLNYLTNRESSLSTVQLKTNPTKELEQQLLKRLKNIPAIQSVSSARNDKQLMEQTMTAQMSISLSITILIAGMLFFGSVLNSSLISLSERQQEIATLHVLGYTTREIATLFLSESLILNLVGLFAGVPLGIGMGWMMCQGVSTDLFSIPFLITPTSIIIVFLVGIVFTLMAHVPLKRAIDKLDWMNALNVKE